MKGFSLMEVMVSLLLMTSVSLFLLKQQSQISRLFNQAYARMVMLREADNAFERAFAHVQ